MNFFMATVMHMMMFKGLVGFTILNSNGNSFSAPLSVLDSDGNSFTVPNAVLDSDGNSFGVI